MYKLIVLLLVHFVLGETPDKTELLQRVKSELKAIQDVLKANYTSAEINDHFSKELDKEGTEMEKTADKADKGFYKQYIKAVKPFMRINKNATEHWRQIEKTFILMKKQLESTTQEEIAKSPYWEMIWDISQNRKTSIVGK